MNKETINIFIDSFNDEDIIKKLKDFPEYSNVIFTISSALFHFNLTENLDLIQYNIYDYKIMEKHNYSFAINRENLGKLVTLTQNFHLNILEITPNLEEIQENPADSDFKINFFTEEYKEVIQPDILRKLTPKKVLIITIFTTFFSLSLLIATYIFTNKSKILKSEIKKRESVIMKYKEEIISINDEKIPDFSKLFPKKELEVNNTLMRINSCSSKGIFYQKLELEPNKIKISGFCTKLEDLFLFEQLLTKNNFLNINNDYIKNDNSFIEFNIDGKIGDEN